MELLKNLEGMSADEQMTAVVELQKAAMKQLEEQKQVSIGKSAEMVIQGLKKIKSDFEAKFDSLNYDIQAKVANLKDGEQGIQGPKGDQGDRGLDGANGRDGRDGKDGRDGLDGVDGVGVRDAKIDFDGSLVISLTDGREINCGEVVSVDVAKQIQKVTHNIQTGAGGDSQTVLDAIAAIQATIATYGTMATQNKTSVDIEGGTIDNTVIGDTTPAAGTFTTLTATTAGTTTAKVWSNTGTTPIADLELQRGTTSTWGGDAFTDYRIRASGGNFILQSQNNATSVLDLLTVDEANNAIKFSPVGVEQMRVTRTASAVNYVQVTGAATGGSPTISSQGSDSNASLNYNAKGTGQHFFQTAGANTFQINPGNGQINRLRVQSSATGFAPTLDTVGSDSNIALALRSTGTGAIDLAAGSSGVNISNGGTVTAITRTAGGSGYTSAPTVTISAPTTAGGVQATATCTVTAGSVNTTFTITNAGSGYVEQPTVSFSGGGGSGAAAYAVVGGTTTLKTIGGTVNFATPGGTAFSISDTSRTTVDFWQAVGATGTVGLTVAGATANNNGIITSKGTGFVSLATNNFNQEQLRVSHTASAVNYVQVTGAATGGTAAISAQGSDSAINLAINAKGGGAVQINKQLANYYNMYGSAAGSGAVTMQAVGSDTNIIFNIDSGGTQSVRFRTNGGSQEQVRVNHTANAVNRIDVTGAISGASPVYGVNGSDTNIDLTLTPKGTGNVRFGTYTANMALTIQGYIEIKDSGGTVRKLAVIA